MKRHTSFQRLATTLKRILPRNDRNMTDGERRARKQARALYRSCSQEHLQQEEELHPVDLLPLRRAQSVESSAIVSSGDTPSDTEPQALQVASAEDDFSLCANSQSEGRLEDMVSPTCANSSLESQLENMVSPACLNSPLESPLSPIMQDMPASEIHQKYTSNPEILLPEMESMFDYVPSFTPTQPLPEESTDIQHSLLIFSNQPETSSLPQPLEPVLATNEDICLPSLLNRLETLQCGTTHKELSRNTEETLKKLGEILQRLTVTEDEIEGITQIEPISVEIPLEPSTLKANPLLELEKIDFSNSQVLEEIKAYEYANNVCQLPNNFKQQQKSSSPTPIPSSKTLSMLHLPEFADVPSSGELLGYDGSLPRKLYFILEANLRLCMSQSDTRLYENLTDLAELVQILAQKSIDIFSARNYDPKQLFMVPINGASVPRWFEPGIRVRVGRNTPWLQFKSLVISRNHCELFHDIDTFYIVDTGSSSGTFVNGERLSPKSARSNPRAIVNGDIIQLGVDYTAEADEYGTVEGKFSSVQMIALLGYKKKPTVPTKNEVFPSTNFPSPRKQTVRLLSWKKIMKIAGRLHSISPKLDLANVRIWIDNGNFIHSNASGLAVIFYKDRPAFTAIYNNFKLAWEIAITDAEGMNVLVMDVLPGSSSAFSIIKGVDNLGRLTEIAKERVIIDPIPKDTLLNMEETQQVQERPFYTMLTDHDNQKVYLVERSHDSRRQKLLGQALMRKIPKKGLFDHHRQLLECHVTLPPEHESLLVLGLLYTSLRLLET